MNGKGDYSEKEKHLEWDFRTLRCSSNGGPFLGHSSDPSISFKFGESGVEFTIECDKCGRRVDSAGYNLHYQFSVIDRFGNKFFFSVSDVYRLGLLFQYQERERERE